MTRRVAISLLTFLALPGCDRKMGPPPAPIPHTVIKVAPLAVPPSEQRAALRDAYRLGPDHRFLTAFGEIRRLGTRRPDSPSGAAGASYSNDRWVLRLDGASLGTVPELPDFPDYLERLVEYAKSSGPRSSPHATGGGESGDAFLMPGILAALHAAEPSDRGGPAYPAAAHSFARIAFQLADHLDLAVVIPSRALALLAIVRASDPHAGVEEEVLLAHALGYTAHAERVSRSLPRNSPLRLFEDGEDDALWRAASRPDGSEEARYLALRRAVAKGDVRLWKEARNRFFSGDTSVAVISTGLALPVPPQMEIGNTVEILIGSLQRATVREVSGTTPKDEEDPGPILEARLAAIAAPPALFWDRTTIVEFARTAFDSTWDPALLPDREKPPLPKDLEGFFPVESGRGRIAPSTISDGRGGPMLANWARNRLYRSTAGDITTTSAIRALVRRFDARPEHRAHLAFLSHTYLADPRAAEELHRSLIRVLSDGSGKRKAESALYLGDWATLDRILESRELTAPEVGAALWAWNVSQADPARLDREFRRFIEKFPHDWTLTNSYVDFLRGRKEYAKACAVNERWIGRNPDPNTPGFFHSRVRLGHGYILAHEYDKARKLMEGLNVSIPAEEGFRKRVLAESMAGLERLDEAEALALEALAQTPVDFEATQVLVRVLWAAGKDREGARAMAGLAGPMHPYDLCEWIARELPPILVRRSPKDFGNALEALAAQPTLAVHYGCLADGFARAGRWEDALRISERLPPGGLPAADLIIKRYQYRKSWRGREEAAAWLKKNTPVTETNRVAMGALYSKNDDVLWDLPPVPGKKPQVPWICRAAAYVLRGKPDDPHRTELLAYYAKADGSPFQIEGRYLLGLATEAELLADVKTAADLCSAAYFLGTRAQGEKRYRDACEWYRVAVETQEDSAPRSFAMWALSDWSRTSQGIGKLEGRELMER